MITRKQADAELILMGQTDHSRLVGQLAAHWGNGEFARPEPYVSVVRGTTYHDYGWLRYETDPLIRPETGEPYQFRELSAGPAQLEAYQWCLDWLASIDRYSGLIVSMHRTGLWKTRYGTIKHPQSYNIKTVSPEVEKFIARNEAWQEQERSAWDPEQVWTNYRLLQVWDLLGLYFCCQEPYEDYIEPVPMTYKDGAAGGVRLTLTPLGPRRVAFDPYPFGVRPCHVQLSVKRLPKASFPDRETFQQAYFQAENELMTFELV